MEKKREVDTDELLRLLFMESSLDNFMTRDNSDILFPSFPDYINSLSDKRGEPPAKIISRANLDKSYGHQIFRGIRHPSRDTVLQLAFGFELDFVRTQTLLKIARHTLLHPRVKRDMVIIFCLQHHYSIVETQIALDEYDLPLLGGKGNDRQ